MYLITGLIISGLILIVIIFAIAQYAKESKLKRLCKKLAKIILWGVIPLTDEDRKSFID
jgi:sorbitol-specific phosphotransferase system component IIC